MPVSAGPNCLTFAAGTTILLSLFLRKACATWFAADRHILCSIYWTPQQEGLIYMTKRTDNVNSQDSAYLSPADLERRWNVSKSLVYKIIHSEGFPAPLRLGTTGANGKSLRFNRVQIEEWERKNTQDRSTR